WVARVKSDIPWFPDDVVCERFTGPLAWLADEWRCSERPRGRPHEPTRNFAIVGMIEMLMQTDVIVPAEDAEPLFDPEHGATRPARAGELKASPGGFGLTFTEVVKLLSMRDPFEPGPMPPRHDGILRRPLQGEALNALARELQ